MKVEKIDNKELSRLVTLKAGKLKFQDVTDEDLEKISEITLNSRLINGSKSNIDAGYMLLFPSLTKLRLSGYEITQEVLDMICKMELLKSLDLVKCSFKDVNFDVLDSKLESLNITDSTDVSFRLPKVKDFSASGISLDFSMIDFKNMESMRIQNSKLRNVFSLEEFGNIKSVNLDGTELYDSEDTWQEDIGVSPNTKYSHTRQSYRYDNNYSQERE